MPILILLFYSDLAIKLEKGDFISIRWLMFGLLNYLVTDMIPFIVIKKCDKIKYWYILIKYKYKYFESNTNTNILESNTNTNTNIPFQILSNTNTNTNTPIFVFVFANTNTNTYLNPALILVLGLIKSCSRDIL